MPSNIDTLYGHRMDDAEMDRLLEEEGLGVLSMAQDGVPYGLPLAFGYGGDDRLYFVFRGYSETGRKVTYAERSQAASFLVYDVESPNEWRSVVVSGPLDRISADEWSIAREAMLDNAFHAQLLTDDEVESNPRVWALEVAEKSGRQVGQ
ncbi:MAG: pyridoxamine 5'-phosphate oxidase family protein [Haloarculaceae archaeon]